MGSAGAQLRPRGMLVLQTVTDLDWAIIAFAILMGGWGYRQGLIVGLLSVAGFAVGAVLGSRLAPALLPEGAESPYAPFTSLAGAVLIGGFAAVTLEGAARGFRARAQRAPVAHTIDSAGGALLLATLGIGLAWLFGVVALNAPGTDDLRRAVQRSAILTRLNQTFPPSGGLLNALNRIDPGIAIEGPEPGVGPPDSELATDPEVLAASEGVVRVIGTACGLGVSGSGWIAAPGLVVTSAHVVAGQDDTAIGYGEADARLDATPVHYDPANDLALLRVEGLFGEPLPLSPAPEIGTGGAVLGYPENGPYEVTPARLGETGVVISEDSYGKGPIRRTLTGLRGEIRSGNSGGPMVDGRGRVLTTVFASTTEGRPGGYGVPNEIVAVALADSTGEADTGPCT